MRRIRGRFGLATIAMLTITALTGGTVLGADPTVVPPSAEPTTTQGVTRTLLAAAAAPGESIVAYGSDGYRYRQYGSGTVPADWAQAAFVEAGFAPGTAAFASGGGCPIQANQRTTWNINSEIVVRRDVEIPAGATDVRVSVAADNDVEVRWNGQDISGGLVSHENCANLDDRVLSVPAAGLHNLLAVHAVDRGGESLLDIRVSAVLPAQAANPVIMVHGINADSRNVMAPFLEDPIVNDFGGATISRFTYYQDKAFRPNANDPACQGVAAPILPAQPNGGMPVNADSIGPGVCDSQSDLALNAVLLNADVHRRFQETGKPVVLIANSMGAAVVRGMLSYSKERGDGIAAGEVDSVFFLEGAHDGAEGLAAANKNGGRGAEAQLIRGIADKLGGINFDRPAQEDLTPKSDWYRWANPGANRLADHPYFNIHASMDIVMINCFILWCQDPKVVMPLGDGLLAEGTDDPFDTPPKGGARFLRGASGAQNHQWTMELDIPWLPQHDQQMVAAITAALLSPEMHANFLQKMPEIDVADCQSHQDVSANAALYAVIHGRLSGTPYECQP